MATLEIVEIARRHLGSGSSLFLAPDIPPKKREAARALHAVHLPESEPILVLYDATIFGGADEGFLATPERLCWRNFLGSPRQLEWRELRPRAIRVVSGELQIAGGPLLLTDHLAPARMSAFLLEVGAAVRSSAHGPYRCASIPAETRGALDERHLLRVARARVGDHGSVHYAPSIPPRKLATARRVHAAHLPAPEPILVLHDATVLGGAEEGFILTPSRLCWRNFFDAPRHVAWRDLDPSALHADGSIVHLDDFAIQADDETAPRVASLFAELARLAR